MSLLSCTSKVLERVVFNNLYNHCIDNNLLSYRNSGFKKKDGPINRLVYLVDKIYKGFDNEQEIAMVLPDITRAFDRVWHKGLLFKLQSFGISGSLLSWFESYLDNRCQRVVIRGKMSKLRTILEGVPQGSILAPLLFLIFIDDIEAGLSSDASLLADDTALLHAYDSKVLAESTLNKDLELISNWGSQWFVDFNPRKTVFLNFSLKKKKSDLNLMFNNVKIERVTKHKHLGVVLSDDLKWSKHISFSCSKASKQIGLLYRNRMYFNVEQMSRFYKSVIRPSLEYGSVIFDNCSKLNSTQLEHVQRRAANVCSGAMELTESVKVLAHLGWESLQVRRVR